MKTCMNCKIQVGGTMHACPLCQNPLSGEDTPDNWPAPDRLKKQTLIYKLQLFLLLAGAVVALGLDFLLDIHGEKHWSLIPILWIIPSEILYRSLVKKDPIPAKIVSLSVFHTSILLLITSWYLGFWNITAHLIMPLIISVALIVNFILSLIDTASNALIYFLVNILAGVIPYVVIRVKNASASLWWSICLMISAVMLIGIIVFKGRKVWFEIQKRMSI